MASSIGPTRAMSNCFVDAGTTGLAFDYMCTAYNDIVIARGPVGIVFQYNNLLDHITLVNPGKTGTIGVEMANAGFVGPMTMRNSAVFGFRYGASLLNAPDQFSGQSDHNATDVGNGGPQVGTAVKGVMGAETSQALAGSHSLFNIPFGKPTFVDAASDYRLAPGSRLIGAGAFGPRAHSSPTPLPRNRTISASMARGIRCRPARGMLRRNAYL